MDVKRIQVWENRHATVLSNNLVQTVIEDKGGMIRELSNLNVSGGRVNAHPLYYFMGKGEDVQQDRNHGFYHDANLLYTLGGNFFCFPNFGPGSTYQNVNYPPHGFTANNTWSIVKYGTDSELGTVWVLSMMKGNEQYDYTVYKLDMMLPNHPVLYTSIIIDNPQDIDIIANAGWHNTAGPPFLESGCTINLCADRFSTVCSGSEFDTTGRLAMGEIFDDLAKAPLRKGGACDLRNIPGMIGYSDFITGAVPDDTALGWASIINPVQQMVYFTFFPGPKVLTEEEIPIRFNNLWMQYGGRTFNPWALYEGGADQTFCLGLENSTGYYAMGLEAAVQQQTLLERETTVVIPAGKRRFQRYATAFTSYDQVKMGSGISSVEQVVEGIVLKRGKSWAFIESDSTFHFLKELEKSVLPA